jgi:hypothetical protein
VRLHLVALLLVGGAVPLSGQSSAICRGQRIDSIIVDAQAPTVAGLRRVPLAGAVVRKTHVITRGDIVRSFLQLRTGDRCTELRRAESERILLAQPFLADADIQVVPTRSGGVTLIVRTIDEASTVLSGSVGSGTPQVRGVRLGSSNLAGLGITTTFGWKHDEAYADAVQGRFIDHQFAGQPYVLDLAYAKLPLGRDNRGLLSLPFRTDLQRVAWRGVIGETRSYAQFAERDTGRLALGFDREFAELGGILRLGPPGKLTLLGLSFTNERSMPDTAAVRITDFGFRPDTGALFAGRFADSRAARVNALIGVRGLRFRRVRGFDALRGAQDIPLGLQLGALVGRGVDAFGARSEDLFAASDLYVGFGSGRVVYRLQAQAEGRRAPGTGMWDGLVGSGRLSRYDRINSWHTRQLSAEWSGTSRVLVPHALSLGLPDGGVRGFVNSTDIGGRRGIVRVDEQMYLGAPWDFGDLGLALFVDAGQLWPGDVPYARTTPLRGSAGASLLLAVPMRSTRMWRLQVALPFNPEPGGSRWQLRLSHSDLTTFFWREPADVNGARQRAVPSSIYSWP